MFATGRADTNAAGGAPAACCLRKTFLSSQTRARAAAVRHAVSALRGGSRFADGWTDQGRATPAKTAPSARARSMSEREKIGICAL